MARDALRAGSGPAAAAVRPRAPDLRAGLDAALALAGEVAQDLPGHIARGAAAMPELDPPRVTDKFVAEAALLLLIAARAPGMAAGRIDAIAARLAPHARGARHLELLAASPQAVLGVALAHVALTRLGHPDAMFDAAVAEALTDPATQAVDRPNFRHLELAWLRALHAGDAPDFGVHAGAGLLAHDLHPAWMRREDGYAATHALMYLTDFGRLPLPPQIAPERVDHFCDHTLAWCAAARDWDLLGEVLIAGLCARRPARFHGWALAQLDARLRRHGALFGPNCDERAIEPGSAWRADSAALLHAYHPTFVYGILCATELALERALAGGGHRVPAPGDAETAARQGELILLVRGGPWDVLLDRLRAEEPLARGRLAETCAQGAAKLMRVVRAGARS